MPVELWAALIIAAAVLFVGRWVTVVLIEANNNLCNSIGQLHRMIYDRLLEIEKMADEQGRSLEGLDCRLGEIEGHVRPKRDMTMDEIHAHFMAERHPPKAAE